MLIDEPPYITDNDIYSGQINLAATDINTGFPNDKIGRYWSAAGFASHTPHRPPSSLQQVPSKNRLICRLAGQPGSVFLSD